MKQHVESRQPFIAAVLVFIIIGIILAWILIELSYQITVDTRFETYGIAACCSGYLVGGIVFYLGIIRSVFKEIWAYIFIGAAGIIITAPCYLLFVQTTLSAFLIAGLSIAGVIFGIFCVGCLSSIFNIKK